MHGINTDDLKEFEGAVFTNPVGGKDAERTAFATNTILKSITNNVKKLPRQWPGWNVGSSTG